MILQGDSLQVLKDINNESIDLIVTDPPYGIEFMGKDWDKALPSIDIWKECYRVLKQGKLAFVMCSPRQDVLSRMIISLEDAGFRTNYTSIYWTYASGFPKAANVSKLIDKKFKKRQEYYDLADYIKQGRESTGLSQKDIAKHFPSVTGRLTGCVWNWENAENVPTEQQYQILKDKLNLDNRFDWLIEQETKRYEEAEREIIAPKPYTSVDNANAHFYYKPEEYKRIQTYETKPATEEAKKMEGAYVGFQPKPAVEVILVVSKGKTLTWLDDCRIPYQNNDSWNSDKSMKRNGLDIRKKGIMEGYRNNYDHIQTTVYEANEKGRFPANLIVSDDVLNDGQKHDRSKVCYSNDVPDIRGNNYCNTQGRLNIDKPRLSDYGDSGSYSRYFDLDKWFTKTFPFLIVPKASKSEKNKGCNKLQMVKGGVGFREYHGDTKTVRKNEPNKNIISNYIKEWRLKKGLSMKEVAKHFPSVTGGLTGCVWNWENGNNIPTPEEWIKLKSILQFDNQYDNQMTELIETERDAIPPSGPRQNHHPTVKPVKLFSYLITMGSRENDLILDPFCGSGTTLIAAHNLHRKFIGIEINPEYVEIAKHRLYPNLQQSKMTVFTSVS